MSSGVDGDVGTLTVVWEYTDGEKEGPRVVVVGLCVDIPGCPSYTFSVSWYT